MTAAFRIPRAPRGTRAVWLRCNDGVTGFVCTACQTFNRLEQPLTSPPDDPGSHSCRCGQWHEVAAGAVTAI